MSLQMGDVVVLDGYKVLSHITDSNPTKIKITVCNLLAYFIFPREKNIQKLPGMKFIQMFRSGLFFCQKY